MESDPELDLELLLTQHGSSLSADIEGLTGLVVSSGYGITGFEGDVNGDKFSLNATGKGRTVDCVLNGTWLRLPCA